MREKGHWGGGSEGKEGTGYTGSLWALGTNEEGFGLLLSEMGERSDNYSLGKDFEGKREGAGSPPGRP